MKCFEIVQKVLDATYAEIPGDESSRDEVILAALLGMSDQYRNNLIASGGPDFSDPVTRFAYVYNYVPAHAHWLYELIKWSETVQKIFKSPKVRMTCLGGGPGSDLVGVLKYMSEVGDLPALFCEIVDGCLQWKQTWTDLAFTLDWQSSLHTDYVIHDVNDLSTWTAPCSFAKSDLFTVNFFASEIFYLGQNATDYLLYALGKAKPGALLLTNDNNDSRFYEWFDQITEASSFETILTNQGERKIYDFGESLGAVKHYAERFGGFKSKLRGNLAWRVLRKS